MQPERRALLERCMAQMAGGDRAFVVSFLQHFGVDLERRVRSIVGSMGRIDILRDPDEISGLVTDAAFVIMEHAHSWDPAGGALPWNWANRAIRSQIALGVGHRVVESVEDRESEVNATGTAGDADLGPADLESLALRYPQIRLALDAVAEVASERDSKVFLLFREQKLLGDPSPSHTVAEQSGLSAANVRQIHSRTMRKVAALVTEPRYSSIANLPLLVA